MNKSERYNLKCEEKFRKYLKILIIKDKFNVTLRYETSHFYLKAAKFLLSQFPIFLAISNYKVILNNKPIRILMVFPPNLAVNSVKAGNVFPVIDF